jgi:thioredoxin 1
MAISALTDENFYSVLESEKTKYVLVDFWAEWCGPCRMLSPVLESISADFDSNLIVYKLNTDECIKTSQDFNITSIPCCILFKEGKEIHRFIGYKSKAAFEDELSKKIV